MPFMWLCFYLLDYFPELFSNRIGKKFQLKLEKKLINKWKTNKKHFNNQTATIILNFNTILKLINKCQRNL